MLLLKILSGLWLERGQWRHWDVSFLGGEGCATAEGGFWRAHVNLEEEMGRWTCVWDSCVGDQRQEGTVLASWFLCWRGVEPRWPVPAGAAASHLCQRPKMPLWSSLDSSFWCPKTCLLKCSACGYPGHGLLWSVLRVWNLFCCLCRLAKQIKSKCGRVLIWGKGSLFYPCCKFFPFQRQWSVWIKHSFQPVGFQSYLMEWAM